MTVASVARDYLRISEDRTLLLCAAPDFAEANRSQAREALLLTTTVAVPHAGAP